MFGLFSKTSQPQVNVRHPELVGCFGKMPIHGDFIRHNVQCGEAVAFENWVQEGVSLVTRKHPGAWPEVYRNFPPLNFVLVGEEQERTLAGSLVPSQDRSGRPYPFSVLLASDDRMLRELPPLVPHIYQSFFQETAEICTAKWHHEPLTRLTGRVDGISRRDTGLTRRQLLDSQTLPLREIFLGDFWHNAFSGAEAPTPEQLFSTLIGALKTVVRRGPARTSWGLRLPLPQTGEPGPLVIFWLQLIDAMLGECGWRAHYFWNGAGPQHPSRLTVFFRPLPGSFLLQLLNPALDDGSIFDLTRESLKAKEPSCDPELQQLLARNGTSMLEVLYKAGRREALQ
jgi:type VI secretion system protein ImpM